MADALCALGARKHCSGGVFLKLGKVCLIAFLAIVPLVFPSSLATGGDPTNADANPRSVEGSGGGADPNSLVDKYEPDNTACGGAEAWPSLTIASSSGLAGWKDAEDWSVVELYRTESMTAEVVDGSAVAAYAQDCATTPSLIAPLKVSSNGPHYIQVTPSLGTAKYRLEYKITANDAGTGADVTVHYVNAMPQSDPTERPKITGSLPHRRDLGQDVDWYQIGTSLAQTPGLDEDLALGLLTATFDADCHTAAPGFTLFQSDMTTEIAPTRWACGQTMASCVAASFSNVYAKLEADQQPDRGAGYNFFAEISPLSIVNLSSGEFTYVHPEHPWCDPLTPSLLGLMGDSMGVVDKQGRVVAKVTSPFS